MTTSGFGDCTPDDLTELDEAMRDLAAAEDEQRDARRTAGEVMRRLMDDKGAQRVAIAERFEINPQTVTNMAHGRPTRAELRARASTNGKGRAKAKR